MALLDRTYAACLACADACERRRMLVLLAGAPACTALVAAVGELVLQRFPNSGDEYAYLYQAATLAAGRLSNLAPPFPEFFEFSYIAHDRGRAYGTFPPGWPLALAAAQLARIPAWLVNPLLGTATLILIWALGRALHGPRIGVLAAAMTAVSGFFIFNAASYFSHTWCGVLLLLAAYLAVRAKRAPRLYPLAIGFLIGWAVLTRYFTGAIAGLAILTLLARHAESRLIRSLVLVAAGGVPWIVFLLAHNRALTGSMWRLTTTGVTMSLWFAPGFGLRGLDILSTQLLQFVLWTPPALLVAYAWYLRGAEGSTSPGPLDVLFVITAVLLIFYVNRGGNQYGPRFYYEAFLFLVIFVAANLFRAGTLETATRGTRTLFAAMVVSVAAAPLLIGAQAWHARTVVRERAELFTRVKSGEITDAIVFVRGRIGSARSMDARDLTRNGIDYAGDVLFALDRGDAENCRLAAAAASRSFYRYEWDDERRQGRVSPLRCPGD